jgi:Ni,Fe-hydrogenase I cytochrome b subunit
MATAPYFSQSDARDLRLVSFRILGHCVGPRRYEDEQQCLLCTVGFVRRVHNAEDYGLLLVPIQSVYMCIIDIDLNRNYCVKILALKSWKDSVKYICTCSLALSVYFGEIFYNLLEIIQNTRKCVH